MNETTTERIRWSESEMDDLARAFIEERKTDPFSNSVELFRTVERKTLDENRRREIGTWVAIPEVKKRIEDRWLELMLKQSPEPLVVHVETQTAPDYLDALRKLDTPSLVAMLVSKLTKEFGDLKPILVAMSGKPADEAIGTPLAPPVSLLAAASSKPRKTRVVVVGPMQSQFREIEERVKADNIPVDLQFLDKDKWDRAGLMRTDHIIATHFIQHSLNDRMKKMVPPGRYHFLQGTGITAVVQKLRDLGALTPPRE